MIKKNKVLELPSFEEKKSFVNLKKPKMQVCWKLSKFGTSLLAAFVGK